MFFIVIALVVVWLTAYQKVEVFNKDDLSAVACGWPLKFIVSDQSWRDPPFPWDSSCFSNEWGNSIAFRWPLFIADAIVFYIFIIFLWRAYVIIKKKVRRAMLAAKKEKQSKTSK